VPCAGCRVPGYGLKVQSSKMQIPNSTWQVLGSEFRIPIGGVEQVFLTWCKQWYHLRESVATIIYQWFYWTDCLNYCIYSRLDIEYSLPQISQISADLKLS